MEAIARFYRHAHLSFKALFGWLSPGVYLMVMVINPLSQLLFFAMLAKYAYHSSNLAGYVVSNALLLCVLNAVFGMMTVITADRQMGTLQLVVASPASKAAVFFARSVFHILSGLFTAVLGLAFGILVFGLSFSFGQLAWLSLVWAASIFAACGLGFVISSFALWSPSMHIWANLLASLLLLLSGASYPRSHMPGWMYRLSEFFPLTRGVEATKALVATEGDRFTSLLARIAGECLLGTGFFLLGLLLFYFAEYLARVKGSLDME
ncbi:ABC transporter permease [Paenibacillus sp. MMS20-IR301]|uniref:ABC transporter permease n=1 Tax=Paenibacillus sp. MMS20-IR301 TaxID=2895946 RepID=UPI0028E79800|nr:ABC transporter permease [Paenibacillus sp. MMS20-IR301]WNS45983.1 ABC transporter permease [Paenibacillus sp. MMS20-IR301]